MTDPILQAVSDQALLLGVWDCKRSKAASEESLAELEALADTAGAELVKSLLVPVRKYSAATFFGSGKVEEVAALVKELCIGIVLVDTELSPSQARNLEEVFGVRVLDRTGLILDIFALHARTREGKLQVELAQCEYLLPRLAGAWTHLSKQRGGSVGLRGPGETQLEVDRRRAREKMLKLKEELRQVESTREVHRKQRSKNPIPMITLVGYTNAGKSTLFNALTQSDELAENRLFATLDPKTTRLKLPSARMVLVSDTVGFIRNLPHQLVDAFKSTFEEVKHSECLLHVIDRASPQAEHEIEVVRQVLEELDLSEIPVINVYNKSDLAEKKMNLGEDDIAVSALSGMGLEALLKKIDIKLSNRDKKVTLFIPHPYGKILSDLHDNSRILKTTNSTKGVKLTAILPDKYQKKYSQYLVP